MVSIGFPEYKYVKYHMIKYIYYVRKNNVFSYNTVASEV